MTSLKIYNVVILGANVGGVPTAHYLLQHAFPALSQVLPCSEFRLTVVSPSEYFYFKISTPRFLFDRDAIPISKLLLPIDTAFVDYTEPSYLFIKGKAINVDGHKKTVEIATDGRKFQTLAYDILIIATGTTGHCLWSLNSDYKLTLKALESIREEVPLAKTILVSGAGPAGVEVAAEARTAYPDATVQLITKHQRVLPRRKPTSSAEAEATLISLGVSIKHNLSVTSTFRKASGQTVVYLNDGSEQTVDIYIDGTGGIPNTSFLPADWLNDAQQVTIDGETQHVTSRESPLGTHDGVYAVGNVTNASSGLLDLSRRVIPLVCSVAEDLALRSLQSGQPLLSEDISHLRQQIVGARLEDLERLGTSKNFDIRTAKMVGVVGEWESIICGIRGSNWKGRVVGNSEGSMRI